MAIDTTSMSSPIAAAGRGPRSDAYLYGAIPGIEHTDDEFDVVARITGGQAPRAGETVRLRVKPGGHYLFVPATGERIGP
jgi:hypothetical protein